MTTTGKGLPDSLKNVIEDYIEFGHNPGSFVMAVMENNLISSIKHMDPLADYTLEDVVEYVYENVPAECFGSLLTVASHIRMKKAESIIMEEKDGQ